jgi:hypothetical protein
MIAIYIIISYLVVGILFTVVFLLKWLSKMDSGAAESSWIFKLLITPGCVVLWPVLLGKVFQGNKKTV